MCKPFRYTPLGFVTGGGKHPLNALAPGAVLGKRALGKLNVQKKPFLPDPEGFAADGHREIR
jgi:hypothetical protein